MRKTAGGLLLLVTLSGCMSMERGAGPNQGAPPSHFGQARTPPMVPGMIGPYGQPVPMAHPYSTSPPKNYAAMQMLARGGPPLDMVAFHNGASPMNPSGLMQASAQGMPGSGLMLAQGQGPNPPGVVPPPGGFITPPGIPAMPGLPPGGPALPFGAPPPGAVAALRSPPMNPMMQFPAKRTQIRFVQPSGMRVQWYTRTADGKDSYSETPIEAPGRYNFLQAAVYRLKLSNIVGRPGLEIYPTLEVVPANPRTEAFLAHNAVSLGFSEEDFNQVAAGNYVIKVIYLPDPQNQDLAMTGPNEIISTQMGPGEDPITEAARRGSILLVIRMGNIDQEAPNTPPLGSPGAGKAGAAGAMNPMSMMPPNMMPGPYGMPMPPTMNAQGPQLPALPSHGPLVGSPGQPQLGTMPPNARPAVPPYTGIPLPGNSTGLEAPPIPANPAPPNGTTNPIPFPGANGTGLPVSHLPDPRDLQLTSGQVPATANRPTAGGATIPATSREPYQPLSIGTQPRLP